MSENDLTAFLLDIIMSSWIAQRGGEVNPSSAVIVLRRPRTERGKYL